MVDYGFVFFFTGANQNTVSISLAASTLVVYDYILTLSTEVRHIWRAKWNFAKFLFFVTRYVVFLDVIVNLLFHWGPLASNPDLCFIIFKASAALNMFGILVSEMVLSLRTWVIWGRGRNITITILVALALACLPAVSMVYLALQHIGFGVSPIPFSGCWQTASSGEVLFGCYILICILESFLLILTLYKGVDHYRFGRSNLSDVIYKDGIIYYIYAIGVSCLNIVTISLRLRGVSMIQMQRNLHSVLASHLLLNIRKAAHEDQVQLAPNTCSSCGVTNTKQFLDMDLPGFDRYFNGTDMV